MIIYALSGSASPALAQDLAAAEELFNHGLAEMQAGRLETGCPAIGESQRLDPRAGTLFTLAECEAKWGRIATAVARYEEYLRLFARMSPEQQSRQVGRERLATAQKSALAPQVPFLTLVLPPSAPPGTRVTRDGVELANPALGMALPIDPGEHVIVVQPPGAPPTEVRVPIGRGERKVIELKVEIPAQAAPAAPSPKPAPSPAVTQARSDAPSGWRVGSYVAGGLGIAGVVVGSAAGAVALAKKGDIEDNCAGIDCNSKGKEAADKGQTMGNVSTVAFSVGAAALATGAVLFLLSPSPPSSSAGGAGGPRTGLRLGGPHGTSVCLEGTW
ncbi:MAG TPA: hypothetical protein VL242_14985 [Sorangium sp.]|nr:hypothetical protein [Sorangium sp.]